MILFGKSNFIVLLNSKRGTRRNGYIIAKRIYIKFRCNFFSIFCPSTHAFCQKLSVAQNLLVINQMVHNAYQKTRKHKNFQNKILCDHSPSFEFSRHIRFNTHDRDYIVLATNQIVAIQRLSVHHC